jgi:hypothetical protein
MLYHHKLKRMQMHYRVYLLLQQEQLNKNKKELLKTKRSFSNLEQQLFVVFLVFLVLFYDNSQIDLHLQ